MPGSSQWSLLYRNIIWPCSCLCVCVYHLHACSRRDDDVEVLIIAVFSATDFTVVKFSILRKYKQCNGWHIQNVWKSHGSCTCVFFLLKLIKEDTHVTLIYICVASEIATPDVWFCNFALVFQNSYQTSKVKKEEGKFVHIAMYFLCYLLSIMN
jgi:hypothetical protein